jgi:hypothetical protein
LSNFTALLPAASGDATLLPTLKKFFASTELGQALRGDAADAKRHSSKSAPPPLPTFVSPKARISSAATAAGFTNTHQRANILTAHVASTVFVNEVNLRGTRSTAAHTTATVGGPASSSGSTPSQFFTSPMYKRLTSPLSASATGASSSSGSREVAHTSGPKTVAPNVLGITAFEDIGACVVTPVWQEFGALVNANPDVDARENKSSAAMQDADALTPVALSDVPHVLIECSSEADKAHPLPPAQQKQRAVFRRLVEGTSLRPRNVIDIHHAVASSQQQHLIDVRGVSRVDAGDFLRGLAQPWSS